MPPCNAGAVTLDADEFKALYPDMSDTAEDVIEAYFSAACLLLDNTSRSRVKDLEERKTLLYLLTRHIAELAGRGNGLVGMLTSASQGSVSVSVNALADANWYDQTQWGAIYRRATNKYRKGVFWYANKC